MAYVPVPKDLTKVKTKVAFGLTKRQLIFFSVAGGVGVPVYFLTRGAVGNSVAVFIMIAVMMPFFFFAMYERDGQTAGKILKTIIRQRTRPENRVYRTDNIYRNYVGKEGTDSAGREKKDAAAGRTGKESRRKVP